VVYIPTSTCTVFRRLVLTSRESKVADVVEKAMRQVRGSYGAAWLPFGELLQFMLLPQQQDRYYAVRVLNELEHERYDFANATKARHVRQAAGIPHLVELLSSESQALQQAALVILVELSSVPELRENLANADPVKPLVLIVTNCEHLAKIQAAKVLANLTEEACTHRAFESELATIIPVLMSLLQHGTGPLQEFACRTLTNLSWDSTSEGCGDAIFEAGILAVLVHTLGHREASARVAAAQALCKFSEDHENHADLEAVGATAALVKALYCDDVGLKLPVAQALGYMCLNGVNIAAVGAIPPLVRLLSDDDAEVVECAAEAFDVLSLGEGNHREMVAAGALPALVELLSGGTVTAAGYASAVLHNMARSRDEHLATCIVAARAIPPLVELLCDFDKHRVKLAVRTLYFLWTTGGIKFCVCDEMVKEGALPVLVNLLNDADSATDAVTQLIACLTYDRDQRQAVKDAGAVEHLSALLKQEDRSERAKEYAARALRKLSGNQV
jgi:hypothetical protein